VSKRLAGWLAGIVVVLGATEAAAINQLGADWRWWVVAAAFTLAVAILVGWTSARMAPEEEATPAGDLRRRQGPAADRADGSSRPIITNGQTGGLNISGDGNAVHYRQHR
jgi:hypothetical protein